MRALTLGGGLLGCAALMTGLPAVVASAAVGAVVVVIGVLGAGLVHAPLPWLRAVAGVGAALLAVCLWTMLEGEVAAELLHPVAGGIGVVGFGFALTLELRRRRRLGHGERSRAEVPAPAPTDDVRPLFADDDTVERQIVLPPQLASGSETSIDHQPTAVPRVPMPRRSAAAAETAEADASPAPDVPAPRQPGRRRADPRPAAGAHRARPSARRSRRGSRIR